MTPKKELKKQNQDKELPRLLRGNLLAVYLNSVLQGLIGLAFALIVSFLIRVFWKNIPLGLILPLTFVFMILFSVIFQKKLAKITIGFKIQKWYVNLLKEYVNNDGKKT
jgi:cell division protein FtsW (lipid II flippase)